MTTHADYLGGLARRAYLAAQREELIASVQAIIKAGGVLLSTANGGRFQLSVGRHYTATERPAYAFWRNQRSRIYHSPRHAAQAFIVACGARAAIQAVATYNDEHGG